MAYVPNPQDPTQPTANVPAGSMYLEFQALKGLIQSLVAANAPYVATGGWRNKLNNGGLEVAQRGGTNTVAANSLAYTLDQWTIFSAGATCTYQQVTSSAPGKLTGVLLTQTAGGTGLLFNQRIESFACQDLVAGKSITVSGYYIASSLTLPVPIISFQTPTAQDNYGAVTVPAVSQIMAFSTPLVGGVWTPFSNTFVLTGDTIKGLQYSINWLTTTSGGVVGLAALQLEPGQYASAFEVRPIQVEYAICQRYYQTISIFLAGYGVAASGVGLVENFQVLMRITPNAIQQAASNNNVGALAVSIAGANAGLQILATVTATGNYTINVAYALIAEL